MKRGYYYYYCYYDQASRVNVVHMSRIVFNWLPYYKKPDLLKHIVLVLKKINVKTRLHTFVSTCRRRVLARSAERDFRGPTIGAVTPTKARANGKRASNNRAKPLSPK